MAKFTAKIPKMPAMKAPMTMPKSPIGPQKSVKFPKNIKPVAAMKEPGFEPLQIEHTSAHH